MVFNASSTPGIYFLAPFTANPAAITPADAFIIVLNESRGFCCSLGCDAGFISDLNDSGLISFSGALFFSFSALASSGVNRLICFPFLRREYVSVKSVVAPVISILPAADWLINLFKAPNVTSIK